MSNASNENLLARLARLKEGAGSDLAAVQPEHGQQAGAQVVAEPGPAPDAPVQPTPDKTLDKLLEQVNRAVEGAPADESASGPAVRPPAKAAAPGKGQSSSKRSPMVEMNGEFIPTEPATFEEAKVTDSEVEGISLKYLLARGEASGRDITDQVRLPFNLIESLMARMKYDQLVAHKSSAPMNDYVYQLTDLGRERARGLSAHCTYYGSAPVALKDYIESVNIQSLTTQHPTASDLKRAFSDLLINQDMLIRLGPAVNSGKGMFLFGAPGNGKTSIAERVTKAFGETIWIPRAIGVDGEVMRLYDPMNHEERPLEQASGIMDQHKFDKRWIRVVRPTIVVGGELTMENLEVFTNQESRISEAPVQLKSNCGILVIDDFGRQRMTTDELLNRWIVPLEKRYDYLSLAGGKKIQVPFDQLVIFSTNLEPKDLVDGAFLRRIPYKIEVLDPTQEEFRKLLEIMAPKLGITFNDEAADYVIETHYKKVDRPFRCCQPRDLLLQIRNYCYYMNIEPEMTPATFDFAVENYFSVM